MTPAAPASDAEIVEVMARALYDEDEGLCGTWDDRTPDMHGLWFSTVQIAIAAARAAGYHVGPAVDIARLTERLATVEAALKPFAAIADHDVGQDETDEDLYQVMRFNRAPHITIGHLRRARAALGQQ